jgi:uncharacterized sulfatase
MENAQRLHVAILGSIENAQKGEVTMGKSNTEQPNFVFIMTDTQNRSMVGAYGDPSVDTPNLDRLAETGVRFDSAYTACPLCTPARGSLFSGTYPQSNGAWTNNVAPSEAIPLMGTIFSHYGYQVAYTGKWHLDGSSYFGNGQAGGGFPQRWWYDGKCYADEIGEDLFGRYVGAKRTEDLIEADFREDNIWGHRVADRALDFLEAAGEEPFLLAVSFDEPHAPHVAPHDYWERFSKGNVPRPPNYNAPVENKPELQRIHREDVGDVPWEETARALMPLFGCNAYIDREIGRVIEGVENLHNDNTVIIYTSDHGDMMGAHGLTTKGPIMYDDICRIPLLVRMPGSKQGRVTRSVASHVDIIPTMLDLIGAQVPGSLCGKSLASILKDGNGKPAGQKESGGDTRDFAHISFHRFAVNHDKFGGFYPIRCVTDGRYKLAINLFDTDELYDLDRDPLEVENRITDKEYADIRDDLHERILTEMDRTRDPFRSFQWAQRSWRSSRKAFYYGGQIRSRPPVFFFDHDCIEPGGAFSGRAKRYRKES